METIDKNKKNEYKFWKDSKMMGMILLIFAVTLQIFSFIHVPVLSTINSYTIGLLIGACNPFFYIFIVYISLTMMFKETIKLPSWLKLTKISYLFVALSATLVVSATGHYQTSGSWTSIGTKSFKAMDDWFVAYTKPEAWYPASSYGGALGAFLYSFFAMFTTGIGALVISIVLIIIALSIMLTGSSIGLYRDLLKKKNLALTKKEIPKAEVDDFEKILNTSLTVGVKKELKNKDTKIKSSKNKKEKEEKVNLMETIDFPFEDPFKE